MTNDTNLKTIIFSFPYATNHDNFNNDHINPGLGYYIDIKQRLAIVHEIFKLRIIHLTHLGFK